MFTYRSRYAVIFTLAVTLAALTAWGLSSSGGAADTGTVYRLSAIYPQTETSTFGRDYYLNEHSPLVEELFALMSIEVNEGVSGADEGTPPPYAVMTDITFATLKDLQNAVVTHGAEVVGDIPNFTDVETQLQINRSSE